MEFSQRNGRMYRKLDIRTLQKVLSLVCVMAPFLENSKRKKKTNKQTIQRNDFSRTRESLSLIETKRMALTNEFSVLRPSKRDWDYRGRPGAQQYAYSGVSYSDSSAGESPAISLPTPPPPPLMAPPPPPPRRPPRRSVTFADSPLKSPKKVFSRFPRRTSSVATLDVAVPWTPVSPRHWTMRDGKPEYVTWINQKRNEDEHLTPKYMPNFRRKIQRFLRLSAFSFAMNYTRTSSTP